MSKEELLAYAAECARDLRRAQAELSLWQLHLARVNYERRRKGLPVVHGWARLADVAVAARLRCPDVPPRRGPF
jgi:hypothetical protein